MKNKPKQAGAIIAESYLKARAGNDMKFDVYGKKIQVLKTFGGWEVLYIGNEGKNRTAHDILIPSDLAEDEILGYLEDLLHEWATPENNRIIELK